MLSKREFFLFCSLLGDCDGVTINSKSCAAAHTPVGSSFNFSNDLEMRPLDLGTPRVHHVQHLSACCNLFMEFAAKQLEKYGWKQGGKANCIMVSHKLMTALPSRAV